MSWRTIVISKRAKLDLQLGYMVVRSEEVTKIVLSEISTILIESTAVSLTTGLLAELSKRKIKVIFCDEKRNPSYLEVLFGPQYEVIPVLVLTKAEDLYQYVELPGTTAELPVCSGDMLFNIFDEYLGFLEGE